MLRDSEYYFHKAAVVLDLPVRIREILLTPLRVVKVELVIDDDRGQLQHYLGFRVQHNKARGPMKGFGGGEACNGPEVITWDVDVLIPAAR